jgi:transcription elongation factor Elf1
MKQQTEKSKYDLSRVYHKYKKGGICPICKKEKERLTTDTYGNIMCSDCFIKSL